MFLKAGVACCLVMAAALGTAGRGRLDRTIERSTDRLTQWLGPAPAPAAVEAMTFSTAVWSAPESMDIESQAVFQLARARFSAIAESPATTPFLDGVAGHLASRIVEDLFDLEHHRPGHHAIEVPLFGGHVRWGIPSLGVSRRGRDERLAPAIAHATDAVETLENVVGWPALAAALRVVAAQPGPIDGAGVQRLLETSLGVPVGWFMAALQPGFRVNHTLTAVASEPASCGSEQCVRTIIDVARNGDTLFGNAGRADGLRIAIRIDFSDRPGTTIWWDGRESARFTVESAIAPAAVRLDPERAVALDDDFHDQRWLAAPPPASRPVKAVAAWLVWLQHAVLTYAVLL